MEKAELTRQNELFTKPALYLLDSYAIVYRSYFAFMNRPLRNSSGQNVSAIYGFFRFLFALFDQRKPKAFAAVFDSKGKTFRHDLYEAYKATRQKTPEDLLNEVPVVEEILSALKVPILRKEGYEADDVIATLASWCKRDGRKCYIISGDKDLLQLVNDGVHALRPQEGFSFKELDEDGVREEWGVDPVHILDYLSLTGDASDNIPGVKGIGDKTALKLMHEYGSLDAIYENLASVKPDSLRLKLEQGKDSAYASRELVTLKCDLDVGLASLDELSVDSLDRVSASPFFLREGMRSLVAPGNTDKALTSSDASTHLNPASSTSASSTNMANQNQSHNESQDGDLAASIASLASRAASEPSVPSTTPGLGEVCSDKPMAGKGHYTVITEETALSDLIDACRGKGLFAFDTETDSLDCITADLVGFSLSHSAGEAFYIPLQSPDSPTLSKAAVQRQLIRLFEPGVTVIGHNLKFDIHIMLRIGVRVACSLFDTMIAAWVLDSDSNSFSLESLSERLLGISGLNYEDVVPKGKTFESVPIATAVQYASEDADFAYRLYWQLKAALEAEKLTQVFFELEMPLIPILVAMEENGIVVNATQLREYGKELEHELADIERQVWQLVGHEFNLASTKQLQDVLFAERKLPVQKRTKTGFSTDTAVLEELAPLDPVPQLILRQRTLSKLKSTYVDTLSELAERSGRIHTTYLQTGAATGRLSSRDPNLQNIPVREEEGRRIRSAFTAEPGNLLISADYSQIELVVMAHLSGDSNLVTAFKEGVDIHRRTASLIFGVPENEVTPENRRVAKTINFGVIYGMSAFRLARDLGISNGKAQEFINTYFSTYSGVADFIQKTIAQTELTGYAMTLFGRRRKIPAINSRNKTERQAAQRVAVNTPIQGSAADIVKRAMILVDDALEHEMPEVRMLLQVHDELVFEAPKASVEKASALIKQEMEHAAQLLVPLKVSIETAFSWGEMH
ncbi:MAG TPA: DNA polymerase I [Spirochaetales bacterium]|nr:DNA polymerase I [Spirochaetales bacterium]